MEGSLLEVIGNQIILNSLPPYLIPVLVYISYEAYVNKHFSTSDQI